MASSSMHRAKAGIATLAAAVALLFMPPVLLSQQTAGSGRLVLLLDAAHGGDDTGARLANDQLEKNFTLALGVRLRSLLTARGFSVVTTRETDTALAADQRATIANHAHSDLCLVLHATESGSGIHIFTSALAPAPAAGRFPAWKTAQSPWITRSTALAGTLNAAMSQAGLSVALGRAGLPGMDSMTCPAAAIEIAPERAPGGAVTAEPADSAYSTRVASAIAAALVQWAGEARQP